MINNPLLDTEFLHDLDSYRNRITYARITSLTAELYPVEQIEGVVTDGNITIDGNSAVRRICSLTMTTKNVNLNNVYWGVTSRVKIEIGLAKNFEVDLESLSSSELTEMYREKYLKYPDIIWFPLGVYILTDFKTSSQVNNYTISLTGKDKMCLLNGDIGGNFNAETDLGQEEIQQEDGSYKRVYRSIPYIIREMVHHYAQEPFNNIIIKDINELALEVMRNNSDIDIYIVENVLTGEYYEAINSEAGETKYEYVSIEHIAQQIDFSAINSDNFVFATSVDEDDISLLDPSQLTPPTQIKRLFKDESGNIIDTAICIVLRIQPGEDIGYQLRELTYPEDLIAGIGETVTSVLDKIVKQFGDYEYFYNIDGQFVFQAKQTYVNTSWNNIYKAFSEDKETFVKPSAVAKKVVYNFEGSTLTTAYQNTPNISKVKNDYTVWGKKKSGSGKEIPIHMRYAIDLKPWFYKAFDGTMYISEDAEDLNMDLTDLYKDYKTAHPIPNYLEDKTSWWNILDWKQYYTDVTEIEPTQVMRYYQASNNKGYNKSIVFPTGERVGEYLEVVFDNPPITLTEKDAHKIYINKTPAFIFDVQSEGTWENYPVGWKGWVDGHDAGDTYLNPVGGRYCINTAFMHRLGQCTAHTYDWFVEQAVRNNYTSWVYQPTITDQESIVNPDKVIANAIVCDWREIIYQMAKDYYLHNHEDDFYYQLRLNNFLPNANIILYQNGHTGYEQYYHDLEGFWRQLYLPDWAIGDKEEYFDQFRQLTATDVTNNKNVTFYFEKIPYNNDIYTYQLINSEDGSIYKYNLQELIERDNRITEDESRLKQEEENFNSQLILRESYLNNDKIKQGMSLYSDLLQKLKEYKNIYIAVKDGTYSLEDIVNKIEISDEYEAQIEAIIQDSTLSDEEKNYRINQLKAEKLAVIKEVYHDSIEYLKDKVRTVFNNYLQKLNDLGCLIDGNEYQGYIGNCINNFMGIINLEYSIQEDIKNVMPGYSNINYSCKNEEDFYKSVSITQRGFPVIWKYIDLDDEIYHGWNKDVVDDPSNLLFWFDFFNAESIGIGQFSVPAIGDRPKVVNNDAIKAIIYKDIPDIVFIKGSDYIKYEDDLPFIGDYTYMLITNENDESTSFVYDFMQEEIPKIVRSTRGRTAQEEIDNLLYNFGYCNENITITSVPIYYLEPNTIISAKDEQRVVNGYYILNKMTIPLKYNGTMQITAIRVPERVY